LNSGKRISASLTQEGREFAAFAAVGFAVADFGAPGFAELRLVELFCAVADRSAGLDLFCDPGQATIRSITP
jgi:hypothetical protein